MGTTSFIYPAGYVSNVRRLAPFFDEIELLALESDHLPSRNDIKELNSISKTHGITYNVHLPMDIDLAAESPETRRRSITSIAETLDRVAPLQPTTHTLHLTLARSPESKSAADIEAWPPRVLESIALLLKTTGMAARRISVETLDFSPSRLAPIVETLDLSICVDVGHVILYGFNLAKVLKLFAARTTILHLHGVAAGRDHLAVRHFKPDDRKTISRYLQNFKGSVSIEVFNLEHLTDSIECFPDLMNLAKTEKRH